MLQNSVHRSPLSLFASIVVSVLGEFAILAHLNLLLIYFASVALCGKLFKLSRLYGMVLWISVVPICRYVVIVEGTDLSLLCYRWGYRFIVTSLSLRVKIYRCFVIVEGTCLSLLCFRWGYKFILTSLSLRVQVYRFFVIVEGTNLSLLRYRWDSVSRLLQFIHSTRDISIDFLIDEVHGSLHSLPCSMR